MDSGSKWYQALLVLSKISKKFQEKRKDGQKPKCSKLVIPLPKSRMNLLTVKIKGELD